MPARCLSVLRGEAPRQARLKEKLPEWCSHHRPACSKSSNPAHPLQCKVAKEFDFRSATGLRLLEHACQQCSDTSHCIFYYLCVPHLTSLAYWHDSIHCNNNHRTWTFVTFGEYRQIIRNTRLGIVLRPALNKQDRITPTAGTFR